MLKFREDLVIKVQDELVSFYGYYNAKVNDLSSEQLSFIIKLKEGIPEEYSLTTSEKKLVMALRSKNLLIEVEDCSSRNDYWLSHFNLEDTNIAKVRSTKIMIIGCGGTGSIICDHLARLGFNNFTLIDPAILNKEDLNRQLPYTKNMVGGKKINLLKKYLHDNYDLSNVTAVDRFLNSPIDKEILNHKADFIINCADQPQYDINLTAIELSKKNNCPIIFGSVGIDDFMLGPLVVTENEKNQYIDYISNLKILFGDENKIIKSSNCLTNTLASAEIALECFLFLTKIKPPISKGKAWLFKCFTRTNKLIANFSD